jgi:hypothetical protein
MMEIKDGSISCPGIWRSEDPALRDAVEQLEREAEIPLPESYLRLLAATDGGEGDLGAEPGWISLWPAEEVLNLNRSYEVEQHATGLFGIGSNGGGELFALDTRKGEPFPIVSVPFIPLDVREARVVAPDFDVLLSLLGVSLDAE